VQRLVELAVQLLMLAQLQSGQPFCAQRVDAIDPKAGAYGEAAASLEIVGQVEPQAKVVGAGLAAVGADQQGVALTLMHYLVIDLTEVVGAVNGAHVLGQMVRIQGFAKLLAYHAAYYLVGDLAAVDHPDVVDDRLAMGAGTGQVAPGAVIPGGGAGVQQGWLPQARSPGRYGPLRHGRGAEGDSAQFRLQQRARP